MILTKLFILCLEQKLQRNDRTIAKILATYNNDPKDDLFPNGINNQEHKDFLLKIQELPTCPMDFLLDIYEELLSKTENKIYKDFPKLFNEYKAAILFKLSKLRTSIIRELIIPSIRNKPQIKQKVFCLRCKANENPNILLACGHPFCKDCLSFQCILSRVVVKSKSMEIKCPYKKCNYLLSKNEIKQAIGSIHYFYYDDFQPSKTCIVCGYQFTQASSIEEAKGLTLIKLKHKTTKEPLCSCKKCAEYVLGKKQGELKTQTEIDCFCVECRKQINCTKIIKALPCSVCCESTTIFIGSCNHFFCESCIKIHLSEQRNKEVGFNKLTCLYQGCKTMLSAELIRSIAGQENLDWFKNRSLELEKIDFVCQNQKCNEKNSYPKYGTKRLQNCTKCKTGICVVCNEEKCNCFKRKEVII